MLLPIGTKTQHENLSFKKWGLWHIFADRLTFYYFHLIINANFENVLIPSSPHLCAYSRYILYQFLPLLYSSSFWVIFHNWLRTNNFLYPYKPVKQKENFKKKKKKKQRIFFSNIWRGNWKFVSFWSIKL